MASWLRASVAVASALSWAVTAAHAQGVGSATGGGVFGSADTREARHKLDVTLSLMESYDSDVPPDVRAAGPAELLVDGRSTLVLGHTAYAWKGRRAELGATADAAFRDYSATGSGQVFSYSAGIGFTAQLGRRTTLQASQMFAYAPSYLYGLFPTTGDPAPGDAIPTAPDYDVSHRGSYLHGVAATITQGLTRRSRLSMTGEYRRIDFVHESAFQEDLDSRGVRAAFQHDVAANVSLGLGYRYRTGTFGDGATGWTAPVGAATSEHGVGIEVRASRQLSASRRMSVDVELSPSTLDVPAIAGPGSGPGRLYRLSGGASVEWQIRRSWQARGALQRGLEYVPGLTEPVYATGYTAEVVGLVHPRLEVLAGARRSSGASALNRDALTFDTSSLVVRLRQALTRRLAVEGEYIYYFYDFRGTRQLPPGFPPALERNGVRAGLTLAVPPLRK